MTTNMKAEIFLGVEETLKVRSLNSDEAARFYEEEATKGFDWDQVDICDNCNIDSDYIDVNLVGSIELAIEMCEAGFSPVHLCKTCECCELCLFLECSAYKGYNELSHSWEYKNCSEHERYLKLKPFE